MLDLALPAGDEGVDECDAASGERAFLLWVTAAVAVGGTRGEIVDFTNEGGTGLVERYMGPQSEPFQ